jgi:uncharacterized delta-60 repeat protein
MAARPGAELGHMSLPTAAADMEFDSRGRLLFAMPGSPSYRSTIRALLPDGRWDAGFGVEGEEIGASTEYYDPTTGSIGIAVQRDGRVLYAEQWPKVMEPGVTVPSSLGRLNLDGSDDMSFGEDGVIVPALGGPRARIRAFALGARGRIVVVGVPHEDAGRSLVVQRYLPDGSLDPTFETASLRFTPAGPPPAPVLVGVQPSGAVVVVAAGSRGPLIARMRADGTPDDSFGAGGPGLRFVPVKGGHAKLKQPAQLIVLPDGRLRLIATLHTPAGRRMAIAGLTAKGRSDRRFGKRGLAVGPGVRLHGHQEWGEQAAVDSRGRIIVAGKAIAPDAITALDTAIRRFGRGGRPDPRFGRHGVVRLRGSGGGQRLALLHKRLAVATFDPDPAFDYGLPLLRWLYAG